MAENKFNKPNITINRVYTRKGDTGDTYLIGGHKVSKDSLRVSAFGEIDELNANLGNCIFLMDESVFKNIKSELLTIQHELFNLGNMIAVNSENFLEGMPKIDSKSIDCLEDKIEVYNKNLPTLNSFVLPGGSELSIKFHIVRTICRRCERLVVKLSKTDDLDPIIIAYLNRLSDLFFVMSRWCNFIVEKKEITWNPNFKK